MEKILLQIFEEFRHFKTSLKRDSPVFGKRQSVIICILTYIDMHENFKQIEQQVDALKIHCINCILKKVS